MAGIFPHNDRSQSLILKRFFMAFGSYLIAIAFGILSTLKGQSLYTPMWLALIAGGVVVSNLCFYLVIRTGANQRFSDPSLTAPQMLVALVWILCLMFGDAQNRGLFLSFYTITMMFGLFRLRLEQMLKMAAVALAGYCLIVLADFLFFPDRFEPARELLRTGVLIGLLVWAALFTGHVSDLRTRLRRRNRDLSVALDEIGKLASHDDLTKLYNRRYMMDAIKFEKSRADRISSTFSLCLLDLDHFKTINDRYGHLAGDRVLMAFSERIKGTLRSMDVVDQLDSERFFGRYGGEEFIVLLPDTSLSGALRCAERIRQVTEEAPFDEVFKVTLSGGVSEYQPGETIEDTLRRADGALYQAKHLGRNRIAADSDAEANELSQEMSETTLTNIVIGPFGNNRS